MAEWTPRISGRPGPRYLAIVEALVESLERGGLEPGARLPTQRALAKSLGLTVGTVTRAYAEAERRGLVEGQVGRGTFVRDSQHAVPRMEDATAPSTGLDFVKAGALVGPFADAFERALVRAAQATATGDAGAVLADAERAASRWLRGTVGVKATPDRLVLTRGTGLAFVAVLQRITGDEGTIFIASEELTNRAAAAALRALGLRTQPVIVDEEGMEPDSLELACWASGACAVVVAPDAQQPTGARLADARRHAIVDIARRYDLWIIEDGTGAALAEGEGVPLVNLAPERTYHLFSGDAVLHPDLALGGIVTPTTRRRPLEEHLATLGARAMPLMAAAFRDWVEDGTAEDCVSWQRREAARRRDLARAALEPADLNPLGGAGYGLWLRPPEDLDPAALAARDGESAIVLADTKDFWTGRGRPPQRLFLGLSGIPGATAFERALQQLAGRLESA